MKPIISDVIPLMQKYRNIEGNGVGGSFHIVLDDGNVKDSDVQFCTDHAREKGDEIGVELGLMLIQMSQTQRRKLAHRFYE